MGRAKEVIIRILFSPRVRNRGGRFAPHRAAKVCVERINLGSFYDIILLLLLQLIFIRIIFILIL